MRLRHKLYIVSVVFLAVTILSQVFVESPLFEGLYPENQWDRLHLALWITLLVTLPAAGIAIASFIAAVVMSVKQKSKANVK